MDRLSTLSEDILVFILSLIDRKDATKTCTLSKSWQYLATYLTNFNFDTSLLTCKRDGKPFKDENLRFLNMVNQVVTSSRAQLINEFRICFPLDETHSKCVDMWMEFAISKGVQKLELDLRQRANDSWNQPYSIKSNVFSSISHLTSLCLKQVKLSREVVELVMSRCHLLERLHIAHWGELLELKIINMSGKLKYLALDCFNLIVLEIHAVNLVSIDFTCSKGKPIKDENLSSLMNQVVTSNRAPFIKEIRICFPLDETHSKCVDKWIKFAILKGVQKLELDFSVIGGGIDSYFRPYYTLNSKVLNDISCLTSLCLKQVKLSNKVVELVMSRCHLLESLQIVYWFKLSKLRIINKSGKLKYLTLDCRWLRKLEIHATNLVFFKFSCSYEKIIVIYASVPSLVEVHFDLDYSLRLIPKFSQIKSFSANLSVLSLVVEDLFDEGLAIPLFPNVRYLKLRVIFNRPASFFWLKCFPEACPLLQDFKLEVVRSAYSILEDDSESEVESEDCNLKDLKQCLEVKEDSDSEDCNLKDLKQCLEIKEDSDSEDCNFKELKQCLEIKVDSDSEDCNLKDLKQRLEIKEDSDSEDCNFKELKQCLEIKEDSDSEDCNFEDVKQWMETKDESSATLPNLRKLEWASTFSYDVDEEYMLALHIVKNAIKLKTFIFNPQVAYIQHYYNNARAIKAIEASINKAEKLAMVMPSHVEFVVTTI